MAALEVVEKRLDSIGIGPFCLELHSNKSKKKDVLEQLRHASEVTKTQTAEAYAAKARQIADLLGLSHGIVYKTLAAVWNLPYGEEVLTTCAAIALFLGALIAAVFIWFVVIPLSRKKENAHAE